MQFGVVWFVWCQVSYHAGSHAGLPAAEPRHGGGDWHLRWREGNGARLGDVGVRGTVVDVIGAAKQNKNTSRYKKGVELATAIHIEKYLQNCWIKEKKKTCNTKPKLFFVFTAVAHNL